MFTYENIRKALSWWIFIYEHMLVQEHLPKKKKENKNKIYKKDAEKIETINKSCTLLCYYVIYRANIKTDFFHYI